MIEKYIDDIKQMLAENKTITEISETLQIPRPNLYAYFSKHRDIFPKLRKYEIVGEEESLAMHKEYYADGLSKRKIALKHGVSEATVKRHIDMIDLSNRIKNVGR